MDKYDFNIVGNTLYSFIWNDFCDKYIELSKFNQNNTTKSVLLKVLTDILKMMHPFMPFVTEEIYNMLPIKESESIMISNYPVYNKKGIYKEETENIDNILEFITIFRNKKAELNVGSDFQVISYIQNKEDETLISNMLKLNDKVCKENKEINSEIIEYNGIRIDILYDNSKNLEEEKENLQKEKENLLNSISRREKLLANVNYVNKAPANIVEAERRNLQKEKDKLKIVEKKLNSVI